MKWKEIYEKSNHEKYALIEDIDEPLKLQSSFKNFVINKKWFIILFLILFVLLVVNAYRTNIQAILATVLVVIILVGLMIYYHTYKLETKKEKLIATVDFKNIEIDYGNLINIFMSRERMFILLFIPTHSYNINVIYQDGDEQMIMTLSTLMVNKNDVYKFFKRIKVNPLPRENKN